MWATILSNVLAPIILRLVKLFMEKIQKKEEFETKAELLALKAETKALRWRVAHNGDAASLAKLRAYDGKITPSGRPYTRSRAGKK